MCTCRSLAGAAALAVAWLSLLPHRVHACGPFFPPELLYDRASTLAHLPDGVFVVEVKQLLPKPKDVFVVVEGLAEPAHAREGGGAEETALYRAGAEAWKQGNLALARGKLAKLLELPENQRKHFSTFASYMLGRMATSPVDAGRYFGQVRELARTGFADPLGLAVASFGEEARTEWREGNDKAAIRLYALQAAHGSESGALSLLFVARQLVAKPKRLEGVLPDPLAQRLLATYAWTRGQESWYEGNEERRPATLQLLDRLGALPSLDGADRLAAAAWRLGRFDLAARFVDKQTTPLALWVQSKLALRRGDRAAAEGLLAQAIAGFLAGAEAGGKPRPPYEGEPPPLATARDFAARATGDAAVLALARGDYLGAMRKTAESCSYADVAFVAEQVLTPDELARFLDQEASNVSSLCLAPVEGDLHRQHLAEDLRYLLARRLLRSGRHQEALAAFKHGPGDELARQYVEALEQARRARDDIERAQALFTASQLARKAGMELLGTEMGPDWKLVEGDYDLGGYTEARQYAERSDDDSAHKAGGSPLPQDLRASLLPAAEAARRSAHAPPHVLRFHYRETAADLAEAAARLVPQRSQAYFALLCAAAKYVSFTNGKRLQELWREYLHHGAVVSDGTSVFGETCPQPQFERARKMAADARAWHWPKWRKRTYAPIVATIVALGLGVTALVIRRKRRRLPPGPQAPES